MITNPYARKRPRTSLSSSSISTSAVVEQESATSSTKNAAKESVEFGPSVSQIRRRDDGLPHHKENSHYQNNSVSVIHTTVKTTTAVAPKNISQPLKKVQPNPYAKTTIRKNNGFEVTVSRDNILSMTATDSLSEAASNPYIKKKNNERQPGTDAHALNTNSTSIKKRSISLPIEDIPPNSKVSSSSVGCAVTEKTIPTRVYTKMSSTMASIRPTSWKSTNSLLAQPLSDVQQKLGTSRNLSDKPSHQQNAGDEFDRLPCELCYTPDDVKPIQDEYRMPLIKNAKLSDPLKNGWMLFPHQKRAIVRALTMRRMILALDMGLGKTLIGAVWSNSFKQTFGQDKLKVYVICPVSLKEEWKRTAEESVGLDVNEEGCGKTKERGKKSTKKKETIQQGRCRGEFARECVAEKSDENMKMTICSWAKVPKVVESYVKNFVVCCDEAHAMQSSQAQRTKDVLNLVNDKRCVGVLLLTGTPMKNGKPGNLFPLLKAVRHPLGRHQKAFEAHFCNGMLKNFGRGPQWDASGASNLDQLKRMVTSNLLHMTKEQCLTELPPMTTIFHDVPVSSRHQVQYEHSIKYLASIQANASNMRDEAVLGAVQRLRVVCAHAKVDATVQMARTVLNKEPAVVIFTYFSQVAKNIHSRLETSGWPCSLLTGETPQNKRQELVDNFQKGLSSVFVCTFGAGGVGLTLTAASTIILLDRPWTPGETRQAEDRIRRIGQDKKCTSYWMRSFDLDKQIDEMLESKKQTTNAVLERRAKESISNGSSAKISINQLIHKFVLSEARKKL